MDAGSLISLAGGIVIAVVFYDELDAIGRLIGTAIGNAICWAIFGD